MLELLQQPLSVLRSLLTCEIVALGVNKRRGQEIPIDFVTQIRQRYIEH